MRRSVNRAARLPIVDDNADFRESIRTLLELEGLDVVGLAAGGEEALAEAERLSPDLVLLDVQLPGIDGFKVARVLAARDARRGATDGCNGLPRVPARPNERNGNAIS